MPLQTLKHITELFTSFIFIFLTTICHATDLNGDGKADLVFHHPGSSWNSVPALFSSGNDSWHPTNYTAPSWANQPDVVAVMGHFDNDNQTDIAFYRPGGPWNSVPVLFSNGDGTWRSSNYIVPAWANQPGVQAISGDFDNDSLTDLAFYRPGGPWNTIPVLFSNGDGSWRATNYSAPAWANRSGAVAIVGDFNADGKTDIAFHRPGSTWNTVPTLFSNGDGSWQASNYPAPSWANQPGVIAISGDFNADGRTDIAFHRPGGSWNTVPTLFANGNGSWRATNYAAPSWANQPGGVAIPGDFNADKLADIAFHRPGGPWNSVPILFSSQTQAGRWSATNQGVPGWANQPGVVAVPRDYDDDGRTDIAFHKPGGSWNSVPVLFAIGNGTWRATNTGVPNWANQDGTIAIKTQYSATDRMLVTASEPVTGSVSSGLWAENPNLSPPTITSVTPTDNSLIIEWQDQVNTQHDGYLIFINEYPGNTMSINAAAYAINDPNARAAWIIDRPLRPGAIPPGPSSQPLKPGTKYNIRIMATGQGISPGGSEVSAILSTPTITIGDPNSGAIWHPTSISGFAAWDVDQDGILHDAQGAGGVYPLYASTDGVDPVAQAGNRFENGSNIVLGYFVDETNNIRFVAYHLTIDPATNAANPQTVLYGDTAAGVPGTLVWVRRPDIPIVTSVRVVREGDPILGTPNVVAGTVTATTLASDGSTRIIDFTFNLALLEQ